MLKPDHGRMEAAGAGGFKVPQPNPRLRPLATGSNDSGDRFDPKIRADLPRQDPVDLGMRWNRAAAIVRPVPPPGMPSPLAHQLAALSSKMPQKGSPLHVATTTFSNV